VVAHLDGDGGGGQGAVTVPGLVGERIRADEVGGWLVGERAVGLEGQRAVGGTGGEHRRQCLSVGGNVTGQHAVGRHAQRAVLQEKVALGEDQRLGVADRGGDACHRAAVDGQAGQGRRVRDGLRPCGDLVARLRVGGGLLGRNTSPATLRNRSLYFSRRDNRGETAAWRAFLSQSGEQPALGTGSAPALLYWWGVRKPQIKRAKSNSFRKRRKTWTTMGLRHKGRIA
jgi:hypothetical protein